MRINVHAGHNPDGKVACGAIGFIKESTENRNVKNEVIRLLRALGHEVYDCTVENGTSKSNVLTNIVKNCNEHEVDLDVSIHFNAGASDANGNGKTTGTEVYVFNSNSEAKVHAERVCAAIAELGFKNRGVKYSQSLYVLKKTKAPAMLIECCFVDDKDDVALYDCKAMAEAIVYGITGQKCEEPTNNEEDVEASENGAETATGDSACLYRVQVGAYSKKANAEAMMKKLKDAGFDAIIVKE
jgi:N-acetylmuramoyl-L-alanine amidase